MHCQTCNYPLWNLIARSCPECGSVFRPSDFEFVVSTVQFCCPHCNQDYYGTDDRGHLVPKSFDCLRCGQPVTMDDMVLRPTAGVESDQTRIDRMPWFEREERGVVKAWFATLLAGMSRPSSLMRAIPPHVSIGRAWLFMFVSSVLFSVVGLIVTAIIVAPFMFFLPKNVTGGVPLGRMVATQTIVMQLAIVVMMAILPVLWVWLAHALLRLGNPNAGPMSRTFHAICYGVGPNCLSAIPMDCIQIVGRIWWAVSAILMLKEAHRCSGSRASFAILGSGFIIGLVSLTAIAGGVYSMVRGPLQSAMMLTGSGETQTMTQSVLDYASTHDGAGPAHALQLLVAEDLATGNYVAFDTATGESQVPVAGTTLAELALLPDGRKAMAIEDAVESLPPDTIAHRVGDFVYTYHGIDLTAVDPGLWLVVLLPDPDANGPPDVLTQVHVGQADGSVSSVPYAEFQIMRGEQNRLREASDLAPLPQLITVTHDAPAVAGR